MSCRFSPLPFTIQNLLQGGSGYYVIVTLDPDVLLMSDVCRIVSCVQSPHVVDNRVK